MKTQFGKLEVPQASGVRSDRDASETLALHSAADNFRALRYVAKIHDQSGDHARDRARGRLDRSREARRSGRVETGVLRRETGAHFERRLDRMRDHGRSE